LAAGATWWQGNTELEGEVGAVVEVVERSTELTCFLMERWSFGEGGTSSNPMVATTHPNWGKNERRLGIGRKEGRDGGGDVLWISVELEALVVDVEAHW
jgi:hypothetical protein